MRVFRNANKKSPVRSRPGHRGLRLDVQLCRERRCLGRYKLLGIDFERLFVAGGVDDLLPKDIVDVVFLINNDQVTECAVQALVEGCEDDIVVLVFLEDGSVELNALRATLLEAIPASATVH